MIEYAHTIAKIWFQRLDFLVRLQDHLNVFHTTSSQRYGRYIDVVKINSPEAN